MRKFEKPKIIPSNEVNEANYLRVAIEPLEKGFGTTLGNAFETPIRDILSTERAVKILEGFDKRVAIEELCQKCGYARRFG